jgi:hypothetical protein
MERRRQVQLEGEMENRLPVEELHRCYQKLKAGEPLDEQQPEEPTVNNGHLKEQEYYRFKLGYFSQLNDLNDQEESA